jgi:asparagine synthase (glutamine-hydrolysing)
VTSIAEAIASERQKAHHAPFFRADASSGLARTEGIPVGRLSTNSSDHFVEWKWQDDRLLIENDRFGLIPFFIYQRGKEIAVSSSLQKLLLEGAAAELDGAALAVFLRLGFFIGDDTPFMYIRALPPGASMVWRNGVWERSECGSYVVAPRAISRDQAIDAAIELTCRAVGRRLPHDDAIAVPLSGGRDSRHLLFELDRRGLRPHFAITVPRYPPSTGEDVRIAPQVAAAVGVAHRAVETSEPPAVAEARKNVATHFCADEHAWFYGMFDGTRGRASTVYEGIGGSLWTVGWLPDRCARDEWALGRTTRVAELMLAKYANVIDACIRDVTLHPDCVNRAVAVDRLARELDRHAAAPDPGKSFHFWNRLRRELALVPCDLMRQFATVHTPLVDAALVDFLLSLSPELVSAELSRADKSFHSDAIRRAYPKYAHLPFESGDAVLSDDRRHVRTITRHVARHLMTGNRGKTLRRSYRWLQSNYVLPRLAYSLINRRYLESTRWLPQTALYLCQLEEALPA